MRSKRIAIGIGIVLTIMTAFTSVAVAEVNVSYWEPQHSSAVTGEYDLVTLYFNATEGTDFRGAQIQLQFNPMIASILDGYVVKGCPDPAEGTYCWEALDLNYDYTQNGYMWIVITGPQEAQWKPVPPPGHWEYVTIDGFTGPMKVKMCDIYVMANGTGTPGVSPFDFGFEHFPPGCSACQKTKFSGLTGETDWIPENGTFTHIGETETFEKELVEGWNLISLPLTPSNNSTSAVLGNDTIEYDAVYRYNATSKLFEDVTTGTMDPGTGYFVNVTTAGTWSYEGTPPYNSMSISLKKGLNMIGWLNCSKQISGNLTSIAGKYNYNARWNADYEVYEPQAPEVFNDFEMMERGNGYWIAAKEDCTLTESCSG